MQLLTILALALGALTQLTPDTLFVNGVPQTNGSTYVYYLASTDRIMQIDGDLTVRAYGSSTYGSTEVPHRGSATVQTLCGKVSRAADALILGDSAGYLSLRGTDGIQILAVDTGADKVIACGWNKTGTHMCAGTTGGNVYVYTVAGALVSTIALGNNNYILSIDWSELEDDVIRVTYRYIDEQYTRKSEDYNVDGSLIADTTIRSIVTDEFLWPENDQDLSLYRSSFSGGMTATVIASGASSFKLSYSPLYIPVWQLATGAIRSRKATTPYYYEVADSASEYLPLLNYLVYTNNGIAYSTSLVNNSPSSLGPAVHIYPVGSSLDRCIIQDINGLASLINIGGTSKSLGFALPCFKTSGTYLWWSTGTKIYKTLLNGSGGLVTVVSNLSIDDFLPYDDTKVIWRGTLDGGDGVGLYVNDSGTKLTYEEETWDDNYKVRKYDTFGTKVAYTLRGGLYTIPITGVYTPDYIPESGGPILGETVETLEGWLLKDEPDWSGAQTGMVADLLQLGDNLGYYNVPDWCNGVGTLTLSSATATWTRAQEIIEKYHWRIPRRVNQEDQYCYDFWMGSGSGVDDLDELSVYSSEEYTDILEDIVLFGGYQRKIDAGLEWKNQTNTYAGGKWVPSATWAAAYPTYLAEYDSYVDDAILAADTYLLQNEIAYLRTYTPAGLVGDEITLYEQYYDQLSTDYTDLRADKTDMISLNAKLLSLFEHNVIVYQSDYSIYSNGIDGQHEWELGTVAEGWRGTYIHTSFWDGNWGGQANRQLRYGKVYGGTITTYFSTSLVPRGFFEDDMMGYGARYFFGTGGLLNPWGAAVYKYDW